MVRRMNLRLSVVALAVGLLGGCDDTSSLYGKWTFIDRGTREPKDCGMLVGLRAIKIAKSVLTVQFCPSSLLPCPMETVNIIRRIDRDGSRFIVTSEDEGKTIFLEIFNSSFAEIRTGILNCFAVHS